ncbi:MAG TPA: O-antigen ligase family protein [Rhizomicrobium sp.]
MVATTKSLLDRRIDFDDYLIWSTLASVFMMITIGRAGIDLYLGYPLLLLNLALLLKTNRLAIHPNHVIVLVVLAGFGTFSAVLASTPMPALLAQLAGITVFSIYYFTALTGFGVPLIRWMDNYARMGFFVAICGLLQWAVWRALHLGDGRLKDFYSEPAIYVFTMLPALGYFANVWLTQRRYGVELLVVLASFICAGSSLGFIGILFLAILAMIGRMKRWQIVLGTILLSLSTVATYMVSANFRLRINDTVTAMASQDLAGTNASTFALLSNAYVAWRTLLDHPLTGVGLGGYQFVYTQYIGDVIGTDPKTLDLINLNMFDANSMILRVGAEFGLPGLIALFGFVVVCAQVKDEQHRLIRNAILPYLLVRIGRLGAYFTMELYFFLGLYLLNYLESRRIDKER